MDSLNRISFAVQMLDSVKHITDDIFLFQEDSTLCVQHSPTAAVLSTSFLLNHADSSESCCPTVPG